MNEEEQAVAGGGDTHPNFGLIMDVEVEVTALLGSCEMTMGEVMGLSPGTVVQLKHNAAEPVELCLNNRVVARGEVVVVEDRYGIKITEILGG